MLTGKIGQYENKINDLKNPVSEKKLTLEFDTASGIYRTLNRILNTERLKDCELKAVCDFNDLFEKNYR